MFNTWIHRDNSYPGYNPWHLQRSDIYSSMNPWSWRATHINICIDSSMCVSRKLNSRCLQLNFNTAFHLCAAVFFSSTVSSWLALTICNTRLLLPLPIGNRSPKGRIHSSFCSCPPHHTWAETCCPHCLWIWWRLRFFPGCQPIANLYLQSINLWRGMGS